MPPQNAQQIPWKLHGWSEREAAIHLLDRFGFGARPSEIDRVVDTGLNRWFGDQLAARAETAALDARLESFDLLTVPARRFAEVILQPGVLERELKKAGILGPDVDPAALSDAERERIRPRALAFARERGYRNLREYNRQLVSSKLVRAIYSPNVLHEVLTDFWFNHFNVSLTDNQCRIYILSFERDAIRPHLTGRFRDLLGATAKHPAMLRYLDNASSTADRRRRTTLDVQLASRRGRRRSRVAGGLVEFMERRRASLDRPLGLNENYARELMELHTLGVDGGYEQQDVVEVARAFTGWSVYPQPEFLERAGERFDRALEAGLVYADGAFLFRTDVHDAERKRVLGRDLPSGRGLEDGEDVLDMLAVHPSTARYLARKLAVRFVSDTPSDELVSRLASSYQRSKGHLETVLWDLVTDAELWDRKHRRQKIKSPFELTVSALRALDAEVEDLRDVARWLDRMGQPLYSFEAPTGYPDRADFWVNGGALLNRMSFGLTLGAGEVRGVEIDLLTLNDGREPESRAEALETYAKILLPERDFDPSPLLALTKERELAAKIREKAETSSPAPRAADRYSAAEDLLLETDDAAGPDGPPRIEPEALQQVVGVLIGSPEFQRR